MVFQWSHLEISVTLLLFQGGIIIHESGAFLWLVLMVFICVISVLDLFVCFFHIYSIGPTVSHFGALLGPHA